MGRTGCFPDGGGNVIVTMIALVAMLTAAGFTSSMVFANQDQRVVFAVMGDTPYCIDKKTDAKKYKKCREQFRSQVFSVAKPTEFLVHVGDIKGGLYPCEPYFYEDVAEILKKKPEVKVPVFIIPGDNEWNDCGNPKTAWKLWERHIFPIHTAAIRNFGAKQQSRRPANFAFVHRRILFVGIALPGGKKLPGDEWENLIADAANWVVLQFTKNRMRVAAAVVFAHACPTGKHQKFIDAFQGAAEAFKKPVLFIHGDKHRWQEREWGRAKNVKLVQVDMGELAPPVIVTANPNPKIEFKDVFSFDRGGRTKQAKRCKPF